VEQGGDGGCADHDDHDDEPGRDRGAARAEISGHHSLQWIWEWMASWTFGWMTDSPAAVAVANTSATNETNPAAMAGSSKLAPMREPRKATASNGANSHRVTSRAPR